MKVCTTTVWGHLRPKANRMQSTFFPISEREEFSEESQEETRFFHHAHLAPARAQPFRPSLLPTPPAPTFFRPFPGHDKGLSLMLFRNGEGQ